ncbi:hypothetical protein [Bdellovibrio sp. KM01]|uniref:hypothetical protein n=1 Tax=Bdellovibrio sp. KM01 TaxID=2748865 RepID=UPI0015EA498A|nr:hypothetical protein [Bdellovibrio sp. KM01]QLY26000.1 hypothetical protein HW988_02905 [Bdellovibrio sp. KM01]
MDTSLALENQITSAVLSNMMLDTEPYRFLIVEDDMGQWPLWETIIRSSFPNAHIDWETSEAGAEALLRHSFHTEKPYDLVISDVFLDGEDTGIDLWSRYGEVSDHFVFVSSMSLSNFDALVHSARNTTDNLPFYLQKPLQVHKCKEVIQALL